MTLSQRATAPSTYNSSPACFASSQGHCKPALLLQALRACWQARWRPTSLLETHQTFQHIVRLDAWQCWPPPPSAQHVSKML